MGLRFDPLSERDLVMIHEWLGRPHVAEWWAPQPTPAELAEEYSGVLDGTDSTRAYIARLDDRAIGFIQSYVAVDSHADGWWLGEHDPGVVGIDQFLAHEADLGRGLGTRMISAFIDRLFEDPSVTRIQTDPSPRNGRAIRCYEKCGFIPARVTDTPDGPALVMYRDRPAVGDPAPGHKA